MQSHDSYPVVVAALDTVVALDRRLGTDLAGKAKSMKSHRDVIQRAATRILERNRE